MAAAVGTAGKGTAKLEVAVAENGKLLELNSLLRSCLGKIEVIPVEKLAE